VRKGSFSIIVPAKAFNDFCRESLAACRRLYPDQELLFSPDEPCDTGIEGVTVVASGPVGPGAKRDLCAEKATGDFLAFLDDDAYPAPGWLEAAEAAFQDPQVGAVGGPAVTPEDDSVERWASGLVYESFLVGGPFAFRYRPLPKRDCDDYPTCNLIVRRDVFAAIGGFDTRFWPGEDTVACLKIVHEQGRRIAYDPAVLVYHHRRDVFQGHLRQLNRYARHRGFFVKRFPKTSLRASYFAPSALLAWTLLGWIPEACGAPWAGLWLSSLLGYALLALLEGGRMALKAPASRRGVRLALLTASGIVVTHLSYGWNLLVGLASGRMQEERAAQAPAAGEKGA
jgi:hypothetical protein